MAEQPITREWLEAKLKWLGVLPQARITPSEATALLRWALEIMEQEALLRAELTRLLDEFEEEYYAKS